MHVDFDQPIALAPFTTSSLDIETEPTGPITATFRRWSLGKQVADLIKHASVTGRIAGRRAPNRRLIDHNRFVQLVDAFDHSMRARFLFGAVPVSEQSATQDVVDQCAFS